MKIPFLGRQYRYRYGYPWRWAIPAEVAWRLEHAPFRYAGQPGAPVSRFGYRWRHHLERKGVAAARHLGRSEREFSDDQKAKLERAALVIDWVRRPIYRLRLARLARKYRRLFP